MRKLKPTFRAFQFGLFRIYGAILLKLLAPIEGVCNIMGSHDYILIISFSTKGIFKTESPRLSRA